MFDAFTQAYADYYDIMDLIEDLIKTVLQKVNGKSEC